MDMKSEDTMKLISSWYIKVWFEDGSSKDIADLPDQLAQDIDKFLGEVEQEA